MNERNSGGSDETQRLTANRKRVYRPVGEIRSFALRQARMSPSQRRDFELLSERYCIPFTAEPIDVDGRFLFPGRPLVMEVGFGMGESTAAIAAHRHDTNFLGVEVYRPGVGKLLGLIEAQKLTNVRIICHDAVEVLREAIPDRALDGVHMFFPDPWPKKRHHKRRLVQPGFLELVRPKLKIGGYLYLATDWTDYAQQMLEVVTAAAGFDNPYRGFCERKPWRPETSFERKGKQREHTIHDLWVVRST